jgi:3-hexulose-6-phosphate synthase/6-phospho-3-hexuloisomerase
MHAGQPASLEEQFRALSSASISDVIGRKYAMQSYMRPLIHGVKISGRAVTVRTEPGDARKPTEAVELAKKGEVIIIDAAGFQESACWGGNDSIGSKTKGLSAVIVDGAVRDTLEIVDMAFPTWAKAVTPNTGGGKGGGAINVQIICGGVTVNPGDLVVADDDGVVVIPKDMAEGVLAKTIEREDMERGIKEKVLSGMTLREALVAIHLVEGSETPESR